MAEIRPFKGYIYNIKKIKDIASVLAPPYDVISSEMQDSLYKKDEFNIVRLILGKEEPGDNGFKNKYKRAKSLFEELIRKDILIEDTIPSIYVYGQEYTTQGEKKNRTGFIALMKLEDPKTSKVLPHEHTFMHPKKDRLKLIRQVRANLSPIFSIFEDEEDRITSILEKETQREPVFDIYYEGVRQRLWRISDSKVISDVKEAMVGKQIFIADGHHRYEVALAFSNEMKMKDKSGEQPYNYVMMYFGSLDEAKLTILATHRAIKDIGNINKEDIVRLIGKHFSVKRFKDFGQMRLAQEDANRAFACGMYCGNSDYYLLSLDDISSIDKIIGIDKSTEWKRLDVTILHNFILRRILKIKEKGDNIIYFRDAEFALEKVKSGDYKLAFFLNPTKLEQVKTIAQIGEKMPHKSTYFYPKLLSGVVINKFDL